MRRWTSVVSSSNSSRNVVHPEGCLTSTSARTPSCPKTWTDCGADPYISESKANVGTRGNSRTMAAIRAVVARSYLDAETSTAAARCWRRSSTTSSSDPLCRVLYAPRTATSTRTRSSGVKTVATVVVTSVGTESTRSVPVFSGYPESCMRQQPSKEER